MGPYCQAIVFRLQWWLETSHSIEILKEYSPDLFLWNDLQIFGYIICAFYLVMQIAFWILIQLSYFSFTWQACQVIPILQFNEWKLSWVAHQTFAKVESWGTDQTFASFFFLFLQSECQSSFFCGHGSFSIVMTLSTTCALTRWPLTIMSIVQLE